VISRKELERLGLGQIKGRGDGDEGAAEDMFDEVMRDGKYIVVDDLDADEPSQSSDS
jgi:hypothetical protein